MRAAYLRTHLARTRMYCPMNAQKHICRLLEVSSRLRSISCYGRDQDFRPGFQLRTRFVAVASMTSHSCFLKHSMCRSSNLWLDTIGPVVASQQVLSRHSIKLDGSHPQWGRGCSLNVLPCCARRIPDNITHAQKESVQLRQTLSKGTDLHLAEVTSFPRRAHDEILKRAAPCHIPDHPCQEAAGKAPGCHRALIY